jgi:muramoyltetrapeptide carboxypeptidase
VPSIHGPVVTQLPRLPAEHVEALFSLLEGRGAPRLRGLRPLCGGAAGGTLFGGNLTVLSHLCGTPLMPDLEGRILLLEDVNEAPYRIDRMLTQLRLAGLLQRAAGVVVGDCVPGGDPAAGQAVEVVLRDRLGDLGLPVVLGAPVGHGSRNLALPLGVPARLDADRGTLQFDDG